LFLPPARLLVPALLAAMLHGCAWQQPRPALPEVVPKPVPTVERNRFPLGRDDSVVGELATVEVRDGDTLPDIARHFDLGHEEIAAANPELDPWAPDAGRRAVLPLQFVLPEAPRRGIVVNLAAMRLFSFPNADEVITYPVGIGKEGRSTPMGDMAIVRKAERPTWYVPDSIRRDHARKGDPLPAAVSPGPDNPLGEYAMYLSRTPYLIHGTNKPFAIGLRASNGCLRLYPENIEPLFRATPVKTPVRIVNQPYLVGWRDGQVYLEAHEPHEELNDKALRKALLAKLKGMEKKGGLELDWDRVVAVVNEARGIPVPIAKNTPGLAQLVRKAVALDTPDELYGQPRPPAAADGGWTIRAVETENELTARRAAAVLNHMGPQIPARTEPLPDGRYRVVAGPFADAKAAKAAARRLLADLEIKGTVVPPAEKLTLNTGEPRPATRKQ
jgi:L,D-transpeptidase ErfK/SrfK